MLASGAMSTAGNLVLVGPMGAGKSSLAAVLGQLLSLPVLDLDREIETACGDTVAGLFERFGEAHFRAQENAVLESLLASDGQVIACGGGVVLAARNRELLAGRAFVVWLDASLEVQEARLRGDDSRPLLRAPNLTLRLAELAAQRNPLYAEAADLRFDVNEAPLSDQAAALVSRLPAHWRAGAPGDIAIAG